MRDAAEVAAALSSPLAPDLLGVDAATPLVVDCRSGGELPDALGALPCVVIAIGPCAAADVVVDDEGSAGAVLDAVARSPLAATSLALLLRLSEGLAVDDALVAESAIYSVLQAGPEHARWLATRPAPRARADDGSRVRTRRDGGELRITLARPAVRNAVDAAMQAALVDALAAASQDGVESVVLDADGPVFSSGGDLDEFGSLADPATAHLLRIRRSPARALALVAAKATAVVHGPCHGAGVELPAFARRVVARPATTFRLPEVGMGLVPGAGGTVGLPRRIGRQRTAWLAITGQAIDAATALAWGLVDEVTERPATGDRWEPGHPEAPR